ncbi:MAG TPA: hypothetical protein ENL27_01200 [Candidatus Parcubacteria bacterium]|nr:hypothetical protein [Candidatus Parcubacteria bacterium]
MTRILFPLSKIKFNKALLFYALIFIVCLAVIGSFVWLREAGKLQGLSLSQVLGKLSAGLIQKKVLVSEDAVNTNNLNITLPVGQNVYEETAEAGEGITHLARKALKQYLDEQGSDLDLTPEHKVYIEDYMQKKTGDRWLQLGEKVSFSKELIEEAINKAQELTPQQLDNLKVYSSQIIS